MLSRGNDGWQSKNDGYISFIKSKVGDKYLGRKFKRMHFPPKLTMFLHISTPCKNV